MKPLVRNGFLLFGMVAVAVMLLSFEGGYAQIRSHVLRAGMYLPAVIAVWGVIYTCNARAFQLIVNGGEQPLRMKYRHAWKLTVSGYAFSYTTPLGFGGGPYRMLELSKYLGVPRAMSKVVLYCMMHILAYFGLWTTAVAVFVVSYGSRMATDLWAAVAIYAVVLLVALLVFNYGYRNGLIEKLYCTLLRVPLVKRPAMKFYEQKQETMREVDRHTAYLLREQPRAFWGSLAYEYLGCVLQSFEYLIILHAFGFPVAFSDALVVLAFSSLLGNVLFFLPLQLGAREGGLALIVNLLGISSAGVGLMASFYTRLREVFWIFVGVALVKIGNERLMREQPQDGGIYANNEQRKYEYGERERKASDC